MRRPPSLYPPFWRTVGFVAVGMVGSGLLALAVFFLSIALIETGP